MKYVFVTGGVCSSIGKGIIASSIGLLLKSQNLRVLIKKLDPYLNIDPGTMNPYEHGEVYVTDDGAETDLDLGHYERFTNCNLTKLSNVTTGAIYEEIISAERHGKYKGSTVQVVPHVTNAIKKRIYLQPKGEEYDINIIEIGGTVGDIELSPFIEAARQVCSECDSLDTFVVHVALVPFLQCSNEIKTKPVQHSVKVLNSFGLQPSMIICRSQINLNKNSIDKLALFCNVKPDWIIEGLDMESVYQVPLALKAQNVHTIINKSLNLVPQLINTKTWERFLDSYKETVHEIKIGVIGKYTGNKDAYLSVNEALQHAALKKRAAVTISYFAAKDFLNFADCKKLNAFDGIIVPGGFGRRGIAGKLNAIKYCRENNIPFLGICLGMQIAIIEYARNQLNITDANSIEFEPNTSNPVIGYLKDVDHVKIGGTMRLGSHPCKLNLSSLVYGLYQKEIIYERHRHRYEINPNYVEMLSSLDELIFVGAGMFQSRIKEIFELKGHDFYVGCQFHPEFLSRPVKPHPLFLGLVEAAIKKH